jgi:glycosyltransferase involved in cell wall biosynthesis
MNSTKVVVSVLMTAYNREKYIAEAIESVLASSYTNYELIISDDCSTDSTVSIAKRYAEKDKRIKVYVNEKNLGDYNNRNKAAAYAEGIYLKYLDSDDIIYPYSIELMVYYMEMFPSVGYAFSASHVHSLKNNLAFPVLFNPEQSYREHFFNGGLFYSGPGGIIIRNDIFKRFNGFSGKRFMGDIEMLMKIALELPVLMIQPCLMWWRIHEGQEQIVEFRTASLVADRYNLVAGFLNQSPLSGTEKKYAKQSIDKMLARHIFKKFFKFDFSDALTIKKLAGFSTLDLMKAFNVRNKLKSLIKNNNFSSE